MIEKKFIFYLREQKKESSNVWNLSLGISAGRINETSESETLSAYYFSRRALKLISPLEFTIQHGYLGYPLLKPISVFETSITHTKGSWWVCGGALLFRRDLMAGIDIEAIEDNPFFTTEDHITELEKNECSKLLITKKQSSYLIWTIKEALSKTLRCGLSIPLELLELSAINKNDLFIKAYFRFFSQFQCWSFLSEKVACSIVIPRGLWIDNLHTISQVIKFFEKFN